MSEHFELARQCLELAREEPPRALVRLCLRIRNHRSIETSFQRKQLERDAEQALDALERHLPSRKIHPLAAARAVDKYLLRQSIGMASKVLEIGREGQPPRAFLVVPRRVGWSSLLGQQPGNTQFWIQHHQVVPTHHDGIEVAVSPLPNHANRSLTAKSLRFVAGGFTDGVHPDWGSPPPYRTENLLDSQTRWSSVRALAEFAARHQASVLVLPELTVDSQVLQELRRWLRTTSHPFAIVVAGSFHVSGPAPEEPRRNVAHVLDAWGQTILVHTKLRPMRATDKGHPIDEDIEGGCRQELLLAPFGLLAVCICLDFCEIGKVAVARLWDELEPALVLVPSMGNSKTNSAHSRRAEELAKAYSTVTVVASQDPDQPEARGFCWQPGRKPRKRKPTLKLEIRWT